MQELNLTQLIWIIINHYDNITLILIIQNIPMMHEECMNVKRMQFYFSFDYVAKVCDYFIFYFFIYVESPLSTRNIYVVNVVQVSLWG